MKRYFTVKTMILSVASLFALYLILAGLVMPWAGKRIAVDFLTGALERQVRIESITFNPFTLEARVKNFAVESKIRGENLASVQDIYLNLSAASLLYLAPVISAVQVTAPQFAFHLNKDRTLNISDLLDGKKRAPEPEPATPKSLFEFRVSNLKITDAALVFTDHIRSVTHSVARCHFDLPLVSTMEKDLLTPVMAVMSCLVNKSRLDINVTGVPFDSTRKMAVALNMQPLDLNTLSPYIDLPAPYKIRSAGSLAMSASGRYEIPAGKTVEDQILAVTLKTQVKDFDLDSVSGADLFACPELAVDASSPNLFDMNFLVDRVVVDQAALFVERDARGGINLVPKGQGTKAVQGPDMSNPAVRTETGPVPASRGNAGDRRAVPDTGAPAEEKNAPAGPVMALSLPFTVAVSQAAVKNMYIRFSDKMVSPGVMKEISSLNLMLTDIEAGAGAVGKFDLHILTGDSESLKTAGDFHIQNDLAANGSVSVDGITLKPFRPYLAPYLGDNFTFENLAAGLSFKAGFTQAGLGVQVSGGQVALDNFRLTAQGKKEPLVAFDQLALSGISLDLLKQDAGVALVELHGARIKASRDKKGRLDLSAAIAQAVKTGGGPGGKGPAQTKQTAAEQDKQNASTSAWVAAIDKTVLDQCRVRFIDYTKKEPVDVVVKDIGAIIENISTKKGGKSTFKASMSTRNKGEINLGGSFNISEPGAIVNMDLRRIDLGVAEPYFTDFLKISISRGSLNAKGTVAVTPGKNKNKAPNITYRGRVALNNFLSRNKVDNADFFSCKSLYATGMDVSVNPVKVGVKKIALTDFYQRAILNKDARLNYTEILGGHPGDKTTVAGDARAEASPVTDSSGIPEIRIDSVALQGGHINFSDYFTQPNFTANMTGIAGSLTDLSSRGKSHARLVLKGVHGGYAPLDITGRLDPLKDNRFIDLTISFKNIELPKFNVYSKKYLGYEIEKGKLILDLHYNIDGDKLNSSNRVLFDQLTLGRKVASKDAPGLPLELAVSLLKNPRGQIDLDLPITGDIADPDFHFGKVVGTVLKNFVTGIVAAPFKFLGGLVGSGAGQDLGFVAFDPGKSRLGRVQKDKLDKLVTVLSKRPDLKLEVMSRYNELSDAEQLRYDAYEAMVLSMDRKLPAGGVMRLADLDEKRRMRLVEKCYRKASFPKPRDGSGREKPLTLEEKETLLITSMPLDGDALSALGRQRGHEIAGYLTTVGRIDIRRVFVTEPDPVGESEKNNARVKATFSLK